MLENLRRLRESNSPKKTDFGDPKLFLGTDTVRYRPKNDAEVDSDGH